MPQLRRFWRSLEVLEGWATVPAQWRQFLGDEYDRAHQFLRCSGELATFYPHRDPYLLIYRVVTHGPEDHVGICDETGERVVLTTADLVIEELDRIFAANHGILTWRSPQADRRNQKRREVLGRHLRGFFRIEGDPFVVLDNGWQARFAVTEGD